MCLYTYNQFASSLFAVFSGISNTQYMPCIQNPCYSRSWINLFSLCCMAVRTFEMSHNWQLPSLASSEICAEIILLRWDEHTNPYDFVYLCMLPAWFCNKIMYIGNFESLMHFAFVCAPLKHSPLVRRNLFCRRYSFKDGCFENSQDVSGRMSLENKWEPCGRHIKFQLSIARFWMGSRL